MATAVLQSNTLDFKSSGATQAKVTATASTLTLSGVSSALVTLSGVALPTSTTDAASKAYVDSIASGIYWKAPVRAATTANVTLASVVNAYVMDGITLATGDRVLIKDQTTGSQNGIYIVQASATPVRANDMAASSSAASAAVFVESGTANGDGSFVCTNDTGAAIVGTSALTFVIFTRTGEITAGNGLTRTGNDIYVNVDSSTIEINADTLRVKDAGITNAKLANSSVTVVGGSGLSASNAGVVALGGSVTLDVNVDSSTIEVNADTLRVKDAGITNAKLANSSLTVTAGDGLSGGGAISLGASASIAVDSTVVRTTGSQTVGGAKTFSAAATVSDTTASTSSTTGCLKLGGGLGVAGAVYSGNEMYAVAFNATSDATLKTEIAPITGALDKLDMIDAVEYKFNFVENDRLHFGVLAQQLEESGLDFMVNRNGSHLSVEYNSLTGLLLAAVKDISNEVKELKKQQLQLSSRF
jgi:hypothetical protein